MKTLHLVTFVAVVATATFAEGEARSGKQRFIERTGGFIEQPVPAGAKVIALVDERKAGGTELADFLKALDFAIHAKTVLGKADNAAMTITLVDDGEFLVNPEKGAAVVPVAKTSEETKASLFKAVLCLFSAETSIMRQEWQMLCNEVMEKKSIPTVRRVTYRKAVEEGWAPAPTNDYQKAIWDAAHTNAPAAR